MSENGKKLDDTMLENVAGGEMFAVSVFDEDNDGRYMKMSGGIGCRGCGKIFYPENDKKYTCPYCGYSFEWKE